MGSMPHLSTTVEVVIGRLACGSARRRHAHAAPRAGVTSTVRHRLGPARCCGSTAACTRAATARRASRPVSRRRPGVRRRHAAERASGARTCSGSSRARAPRPEVTAPGKRARAWSSGAAGARSIRRTARPTGRSRSPAVARTLIDLRRRPFRSMTSPVSATRPSVRYRTTPAHVAAVLARRADQPRARRSCGASCSGERPRHPQRARAALPRAPRRVRGLPLPADQPARRRPPRRLPLARPPAHRRARQLSLPPAPATPGSRTAAASARPAPAATRSSATRGATSFEEPERRSPSSGAFWPSALRPARQPIAARAPTRRRRPRTGARASRSVALRDGHEPPAGEHERHVTDPVERARVAVQAATSARRRLPLMTSTASLWRRPTYTRARSRRRARR